MNSPIADAQKHSRIGWICSVLCLVFTMLFLVSHCLDQSRHSIAVAPHFRTGLFEGAAWFYSDPEPYRGSLVQASESPRMRVSRGLTIPGVYYRYFDSQSAKIWTLRVSLFWPVVASAAGALILLSKSHPRLRDRGRRISHALNGEADYG